MSDDDESDIIILNMAQNQQLGETLIAEEISRTLSMPTEKCEVNRSQDDDSQTVTRKDRGLNKDINPTPGSSNVTSSPTDIIEAKTNSADLIQLNELIEMASPQKTTEADFEFHLLSPENNTMNTKPLDTAITTSSNTTQDMTQDNENNANLDMLMYLSGSDGITINTNKKIKHPKISKAKKRSLLSADNGPSCKKATAGSKIAAATLDATVLESELHKRKKVNIYTNEHGPQWYEILSNTPNVSKPIVPSKLPEAFSFLPIYGRPKSRADLPEFQLNKIRDFVGTGLNNDEFANLIEYCSEEHFLTGKELEMQSNVPGAGMLCDFVNKSEEIDSDESKLCVVDKFLLRKDKDCANIFVKRLKYRGIRLMPLLQEDEPPAVGIGTPLYPGKDIIFHLRIYRPFPYNKLKVHRGRHSVFSRDLIMVGRQRLTELRDSFLCANDVDMRVDVSERIADPQLASAKELFPSGFLFINNVFYVDTRPGCSDISERIREWAATKRGLGRFPCKDMSAVTLGELTLRLGHPEVYVHQGNCEHLFTLSELRLLAAADPLQLAHFPAHSAVSQNQTVYCTTCAEFGAKFIVTGCNRVPFDPAFFCDTCLKLYLYKDGKKICDFKAYSYRGNEMHTMKPQG